MNSLVNRVNAFVLSNKTNRTMHTITFSAMLGIFLIQALYFAWNVRHGIPPDEFYHTHLIESISETAQFEVLNTEKTLRLGVVTEQPVLFHKSLAVLRWVMHGTFDENSILRAMRLINVFSVGVSLFFLWRSLSLLAKGSWIVPLVTTWVLLNTIMFPFLAGAVNYDNFQFLFATMTVFGALNFIHNPNNKNLVFASLSACLGLLTKVTFAPFLFVVAISSLVFFFCDEKFRKKMAAYLSAAKRNRASLSAVLISLIAMAAAAFPVVRNFWTYRAPLPPCEKVLGHEKCFEHYDIYKRKVLWSKETEGLKRMSLPEFSSLYGNTIRKSWFKIVAHLGVPESFYPRKNYFIMVMPVLLGLVWAAYRGWRPWKDRKWLFCFAVFALYSGILLMENYTRYLSLGKFGAAVQPRYYFVVFPFLIAILFMPLLKRKTPPVVLLLVIFFALSQFRFQEFRNFLTIKSPEWLISR